MLPIYLRTEWDGVTQAQSAIFLVAWPEVHLAATLPDDAQDERVGDGGLDVQALVVKRLQLLDGDRKIFVKRKIVDSMFWLKYLDQPSPRLRKLNLSQQKSHR